jgi:GNAT superfamily N-acetyltransferase
MPNIIEFTSPEQIRAGCELLEQMYPKQPAARVHDYVPQMLSQYGWHMIGVMNETTDQADAVILYTIGIRMFCGKYMQLDSLFIRPEARRQGYSAAVFDWLQQKAEAENCDRILLESLVESFGAHKFFFDQGYHIRGYVVNKLLNDNYEN